MIVIRIAITPVAERFEAALGHRKTRVSLTAPYS